MCAGVSVGVGCMCRYRCVQGWRWGACVGVCRCVGGGGVHV